MRALCPGALRDKRPKRKRPHQLSADAADVVVAAPHTNEVVRANSVRARVAYRVGPGVQLAIQERTPFSAFRNRVDVVPNISWAVQ